MEDVELVLCVPQEKRGDSFELSCCFIISASGSSYRTSCLMYHSAAPTPALFLQPPTTTIACMWWNFPVVVVDCCISCLPHQQINRTVTPPWHSIEGWGVDEVYQGWVVDWEMDVSQGDIIVDVTAMPCSISEE